MTGELIMIGVSVAASVAAVLLALLAPVVRRWWP
jgi:hypothetical protein